MHMPLVPLLPSPPYTPTSALPQTLLSKAGHMGWKESSLTKGSGSSNPSWSEEHGIKVTLEAGINLDKGFMCQLCYLTGPAGRTGTAGSQLEAENTRKSP